MVPSAGYGRKIGFPFPFCLEGPKNDIIYLSCALKGGLRVLPDSGDSSFAVNDSDDAVGRDVDAGNDGDQSLRRSNLSKMIYGDHWKQRKSFMMKIIPLRNLVFQACSEKNLSNLPDFVHLFHRALYYDLSDTFCSFFPLKIIFSDLA